MHTLMTQQARPNTRRHHLDACQRIRPVEAFEYDLIADPEPAYDWSPLLGVAIALAFSVGCWVVLAWAVTR